MPKITFLTGQPPVCLTPDSPQWTVSLPAHRTALDNRDGSAAGMKTINHGDYFEAVRGFLCADDFAVARRAAEDALGASVPSNRIQSVDIHLVKHGAFYHPSKVTLAVDGKRVHMALNVAASPQGRAVLEGEYLCLKRLGRLTPNDFLPPVFGLQGGKGGDPSAPAMFAARWFSAYCEFHLSHLDYPFSAARQAEPAWVVWDDSAGHRTLTRSEVAAVYRQATRILTTYYNPLTCEAVLQWHHAAGDFVVKPGGGRTRVRLITVRRYAPFIETAGQDVSLQTVLDRFVLFLVQTSLRMRMDRLDGVGDLVMAPDWVLEQVWNGFGDALDDCLNICGLPDEFKQGLMAYLAIQRVETLIRMGTDVAQGYPPGAEEAALIRHHLHSHAKALASLTASGL